MGCFILSAANFWFSRSPFYRPHIGSPPAIPAVRTGTVLLLVSFFPSPAASLCVFFDVSKEAWNVIELSFSNVLLLALMRIRAIAWKCWVKEKRGPAPPRADRIPQLCSIFISVSRMWVKQEVFTSPDFASYLPALLPRHLTKYRPPVVRLTPGLKWNNPWCSSVAVCVPFFFLISLSPIFRVR